MCFAAWLTAAASASGRTDASWSMRTSQPVRAAGRRPWAHLRLQTAQSEPHSVCMKSAAASGRLAPCIRYRIAGGRAPSAKQPVPCVRFWRRAPLRSEKRSDATGAGSSSGRPPPARAATGAGSGRAAGGAAIAGRTRRMSARSSGALASSRRRRAQCADAAAAKRARRSGVVPMRTSADAKASASSASSATESSICSGEAATEVSTIGTPHCSAGSSFVLTPVERRIGTTIASQLSRSRSISASSVKPRASMPCSSSIPAYSVPHAHPQRSSARAASHAIFCDFFGRTSGSKPTRRSRTPGSCSRSFGHTCWRNHWIARWLVGVTPLPMKPRRTPRLAAVAGGAAGGAGGETTSALAPTKARGDIRSTFHAAHVALNCAYSRAESAAEMWTTASASAYTARWRGGSDVALPSQSAFASASSLLAAQPAIIAAFDECASSESTPMNGRRDGGAWSASVGSTSSAVDGAGSRQNQSEQRTASKWPRRASAASAPRSVCA